MKWNEKVLELMKRNNVSQKQLSEISGIAESSLSRYLHSDQRPRLDIETQYLLEEEETSESAYNYIATAVARKGKELTPEEQNKLIGLILGFEKNV